jgi:hypothetical protein
VSAAPGDPALCIIPSILDVLVVYFFSTDSSVCRRCTGKGNEETGTPKIVEFTAGSACLHQISAGPNFSNP